MERKFVLDPIAPNQKFEDWAREALEQLFEVLQEEGAFSPINIDFSTLAEGHYVYFDATNEYWTNGSGIPANLEPADGDKGDITVSSGPLNWSINPDTLTFDMLVDATQECLLGASAAGTFEEITIGTGLEISGDALNVTASGSKIVETWQPIEASFPATNFATLDLRNRHPVLDFDTTTEETVYFHGVVPDNYNGEGITVEVWWSAETATINTIGWLVAIEDMDDEGLDIDGTGFASEATITAATVPGTSGQIKSSSVNIADGSAMDSLAAGDLFRVSIARDVDNDTATGDAELHMVQMRIQ